MSRRVFRSWAVFLPLLLLDLYSPYGLLGQRMSWNRPVTQALQAQIEDRTVASGIHYVQTSETLRHYFLKELQHILPWYAGSGVYFAVTDFNQDGLSDVFVSSFELQQPYHLFKNNGDGTFTDIGEKVFPKDVNSNYISFRPLFFDCDNDGYPDLFITTSTGCPKLYHNEHGQRFRDITAESGLSKCIGISHATNAVDFFNDGNLGVVYAGYDIYGKTGLADSMFSASTQEQKVVLYRNMGGCHFTELKNSGIKNTGHTHVIGVADLRGMNRHDLWFATDYGPDRVFFDNGDGTFQDASYLLRDSFNRNGMDFDLAYLNDDESPYIYVSHVFEPGYLISGNALWHFKDGEIRNYARTLGVANCGHAWGGKFMDLENTGDEDLVVANGYFSNSRKKDYKFTLGALSMTVRGYLRDATHWPAFNDASLYGYEKKCLFVQREGHFYPPKETNPITLNEMDGRGVASIDAQNDGGVGVLIGAFGNELKFYQSNPKKQNHWIGFHLTGVCSNRDALGAKIRIQTSSRSLLRYVYPTNGFLAQSDAKVHVGLGTEAVKRIEIAWPSGWKDVLKNPKSDIYNEVKESGDCRSQKVRNAKN